MTTANHPLGLLVTWLARHYLMWRPSRSFISSRSRTYSPSRRLFVSGGLVFFRFFFVFFSFRFLQPLVPVSSPPLLFIPLFCWHGVRARTDTASHPLPSFNVLFLYLQKILVFVCLPAIKVPVRSIPHIVHLLARTLRAHRPEFGRETVHSCSPLHSHVVPQRPRQRFRP
jgi:hypothetical protein